MIKLAAIIVLVLVLRYGGFDEELQKLGYLGLIVSLVFLVLYEPEKDVRSDDN